MKLPRLLFFLAALLLISPSFPQTVAPTKGATTPAAKTGSPTSTKAAPTKSAPAAKAGSASGAKAAPAKFAPAAKAGTPSNTKAAPGVSPKSSTSATKTASTKGKSKKGQSARTSRTRGQQAPDEQRIREIQQALAGRGYSLAVSGKWDQQTVEALKKFQEDKSITNMSGRGKLDSLTLIALGLGPKQENSPTGQGAPKAVTEGRLP